MMLIEVKEIHPSPGERKPASVIAMDDKKYDIWPENLGGVLVGRRYEVETKPREWKGRTFFTITKATPVNAAAPTPANNNGHVHPAGNGNSGPVTATEAAFVREVLCAFIMKGDVPYAKRALFDATMALRELYRTTFGNRGSINGGDDA